MTAPELTCKELVEVVTEYLEGRMPVDHRLRLEAHLAFCSGCQTYIAQMRETIRSIGALREEDVSAEARDALLDVLHAWKRR